MIGGNFVGTPEIERVQSTYIHAPALMKLLGGKPAWMYFTLNPRRCGTVIAIDGKDNWNIHNFLYNGEPTYDSMIAIGQFVKYSASGLIFTTKSFRKKTGWPPIGLGQIFVTGVCLSAVMPDIFGSPPAATE